jgi:hypothetical protein
MANPEHVRAVIGDLAAWRTQNPNVVLDLSGADFRGKDLPGRNLAGAELLGAQLQGANLANAVLTEAKLVGADLRGANLDGADLTRADLTRAVVDGASITGITREGLKPAHAFESRGGGRSEVDVWLFKLIAGLGVGALVMIVFVAIVFMFFSKDDISYARSLITVVFTIGTMTIALCLFSARWMSRSADAPERFQNAREVLTILVGIMGTVIGWYFAQDDEPKADRARTEQKLDAIRERLPAPAPTATDQSSNPAPLPPDAAAPTAGAPLVPPAK